ncbi:MAG: diaminopimelate epimerase [Burkholderiales bacterium]|nr:MAG: diaminopimelate epimerase [Burkholderiales bacterium]
MKLHFTKMHGAGNDFVVLDATRAPIELTPAQVRHLGNRRMGVGADQILLVEPSRRPEVDFRYRIFNCSGDEVEQCGNGARCFVRYVHDKGLTEKRRIKVEVAGRDIELDLHDDGRVTVDMGAPIFERERVPFDASGLVPRKTGNFVLWPLGVDGTPIEVAVLSMGNPHAVQRVADVVTAPVTTMGPAIENHPAFPRKVNAGFMQVLSRDEINLRVWERGAGETLSCGTGACAAVVAGIRLGWLDSRVDVNTRGGTLSIEWSGDSQRLGAHVFMTGPAQTVFEGEIEL